MKPGKAGSANATAALLSVLLVSISCGPASESLTPARRDAIRDSVETFLDLWEARAEALDVEGMAALYSGDEAFRWIEDGSVRYRSREDVRESLRGLEGQLTGLDFRWEGLRIDPVGPGAAVVTGSFIQALQLGERGSFEFRGVVSALVRHEAEGWRFLVGHASTLREGDGEERNERPG